MFITNCSVANLSMVDRSVEDLWSSKSIDSFSSPADDHATRSRARYNLSLKPPGSSGPQGNQGSVDWSLTRLADNSGS
ncbi:hypothetical protein PoB_002447500 [Plakobranchus ocellatus]|uniref:Uncharacterized protein n=1 Tax=Plakobranchus ocellatus TaxID=259542 RepID=A0AAV3ZQG9_9GAST|nr:hypothetical protein PoB_002447500 [Plakobranchus ocellatus]